VKWKTGISDYGYYLKIERGLSKNTIENYRRDLEKLSKYLNAHEMTVGPLKISKNELQDFIYSIA